MRSLFFDFFTWCSGSSTEILQRCPRSEHIKHAGFGVLVLIPALLAFFSMTYALSTVSDHAYIYVPAGICWAGIIFFADRFLVSSFRKANNLRLPRTTTRQLEQRNLRQDAFSFALISRLLLSAFIGVAVAHPLVLLYFHKDIDQVMATNKMMAERNIITMHDNKAGELTQDIAVQEDYVKCLRKLLIYEQTDVKINTDCGSTSGIPGYNKRAETIQAQLVQAESELNHLYRRDSTIKAMQESLKQNELARYNSAFSNGYMARDQALVQLEEMPGSNARAVKYFLILFLILIDTLAVAWKALSKRGPYDDYLHVTEDDVAIAAQVHLMENEKTLRARAEQLGFENTTV